MKKIIIAVFIVLGFVGYTFAQSSPPVGGSGIIVEDDATTIGEARRLNFGQGLDVVKQGERSTVNVTIPSFSIKSSTPKPACDGVTSDQTSLNYATNNFPIIKIPANCMLNISGSFSLYGTRIECEDPKSSGFIVSSKTCVGGRYVGAACAIDANCPGSTCGGTAYVSSGASKSIFEGSGGNGNYNSIKNCRFDLAGWDVYGRCSGGTNDGMPCLQLCSNNANRGCVNNAGCISGGHCTQGATFDDCDPTSSGVSCGDCSDPNQNCTGNLTPYACCSGSKTGTCTGGTCTLESGYPASGVSGYVSTNDSGVGGSISAVNFGTSTNNKFEGNIIVNHRLGDPAIAGGSGGYTRITRNTARGEATGPNPKKSDNSGYMPRASKVNSVIQTGDKNWIEYNSVSTDITPTKGVVYINGMSYVDKNIFVPSAAAAQALIHIGSTQSHVTDNKFFCGGNSGIIAIQTCSDHAIITNNMLYQCESGIQPCFGANGAQAGNVTVIGNRLLNGTGTKLTTCGAGWTVADNYFAWSTTALPVVSIGYDGTYGCSTTHNQFRNNLVYTDIVNSVAELKISNPSNGSIGLGRCTDYAASNFQKSCVCGTYPCTDSTDCPGGAANSCKLQMHVILDISGNTFLAPVSAPIIDASLNNTGGSILASFGLLGNIFNASSPTQGIRFPTVVANAQNVTLGTNTFDGITGAANKAVNWDFAMGRMDTTTFGYVRGFAIGSLLGASASATEYFPFNGALAATTLVGTKQSVTSKIITNAVCCVSTVTGSGKTRTITLEKNGVDSAVVSTISSSSVKCVAATGVPYVVADGDDLNWKDVPTSSPAGSNVSCTTDYYTTGFDR